MKRILLLAVCSSLLTACGKQDKAGVEGPTGNVEDDFVFVKGGTYQMGASEKELGLFRWTGGNIMESYVPKTVTVGDFRISKYEVTLKQFKELLPNARLLGKNVDDNAPVFGISWERAIEFCNTLNEREGYDGWYKKERLHRYGYDYVLKENGNGYRLPTNEEWEYAARGGNQSKGYAFSGSDDVMEVAHFGAGVPCKVGMYKPNELGIYDMTGNVNEYVHRVDEKGMRAGSQGGGFKLEGPVNQLVIYNRHGWGDEVAGFRLVLVGEKPKNAKQGFLSNDWKTYRLRGKVKSCKLHLEVEFDERGRLIRDNEICVEYAGDDNTRGTVYYGRGADRYKVGEFTPGRNNYLLVRDDGGHITQLSGDMEGREYEYDGDGFTTSEQSGVSSHKDVEKFLGLDENGNPLSAKLNGGDEFMQYEYHITYSDYKLEKAGNWIERTAHKKGYTIESDGDYNLDPSTRKEVDETEVQERTIEYF